MTTSPRLLDTPTYTGQKAGAILTYKLPAAMCREIGRIIVKYATLEHMLSQTIYLLLGIDRQTGRIAVREPRATDRLKIIYDLASERALTFSIDTKLVASIIETVQSARDSLAHTVWTEHHYATHTVFLLARTKGSWAPGGNIRVNRTAYPQGQEVNTDDLKQVTDRLGEAIRYTETIIKEIVAFQPPSLDTPMKRSHPTGRLPNPIPKAPKRRPKASRE